LPIPWKNVRAVEEGTLKALQGTDKAVEVRHKQLVAKREKSREIRREVGGKC
jgi:uncharacterized protein YecE (DUF72 family)